MQLIAKGRSMRIAAIAMLATLVLTGGGPVVAQDAGKAAETAPIPAPSDAPSAARIEPIVPPVKRVVPKAPSKEAVPKTPPKEAAPAAKKGAKEPVPKKAAAGKSGCAAGFKLDAKGDRCIKAEAAAKGEKSAAPAAAPKAAPKEAGKAVQPPAEKK